MKAAWQSELSVQSYWHFSSLGLMHFRHFYSCILSMQNTACKVFEVSPCQTSCFTFVRLPYPTYPIDMLLLLVHERGNKHEQKGMAAYNIEQSVRRCRGSQWWIGQLQSMTSVRSQIKVLDWDVESRTSPKWQRLWSSSMCMDWSDNTMWQVRSKGLMAKQPSRRAWVHLSIANLPA